MASRLVLALVPALAAFVPEERPDDCRAKRTKPDGEPEDDAGGAPAEAQPAEAQPAEASRGRLPGRRREPAVEMMDVHEEVELPENPGVVERDGKRVELATDEKPQPGDVVIKEQGPKVKQVLVRRVPKTP